MAYKVRYTLHGTKKIHSKVVSAKTPLEAFRKVEKTHPSARLVLPIKKSKGKSHRRK